MTGAHSMYPMLVVIRMEDNNNNDDNSTFQLWTQYPRFYPVSGYCTCLHSGVREFLTAVNSWKMPMNTRHLPQLTHTHNRLDIY